MAEQGLKDKTVKGVAWSGVDNVVQFGITFLVSLVLARLLTPDDYGLIGIIAIFTEVCATLINGGFVSALIRKKDATNADYNTVFIANLCISILLYVLIFLCSPLIAAFFGRNELVSLTRVSSLTMIVGAFAMVQQTRLTKRIDFKTQTKITIIASVASGIVGITMAFLGFGVWSLVAQQLSSQFCRTILLWVFNKWVPSLQFSSKSFRELFDFGWKLMVSGVLDTGWKELFKVVVGKCYSPATLGQYTRATQFSRLFSSTLTAVIQRVTYPILSIIQDDNERMISAYRRIIRTSCFITAVCLLWLGAIAEPLLYCLIGPQWDDAATYLPLICISATLYPLHAINLNMLQVQGRSDLFLGIEIIKKIISITPLVICVFWGVMPMLYVNIFTGFLCYLVNSYFSGKILGYSSWMQIKDIAPSYGVALIISISVFFLKYLPLTNWIILPLQLIIGTVVFFLICEKSQMQEYIEIKAIIISYIKRFKNDRKRV